MVLQASTLWKNGSVATRGTDAQWFAPGLPPGAPPPVFVHELRPLQLRAAGSKKLTDLVGFFANSSSTRARAVTQRLRDPDPSDSLAESKHCENSLHAYSSKYSEGVTTWIPKLIMSWFMGAGPSIKTSTTQASSGGASASGTTSKKKPSRAVSFVTNTGTLAN